jgi:hypothetical protein
VLVVNVLTPAEYVPPMSVSVPVADTPEIVASVAQVMAMVCAAGTQRRVFDSVPTAETLLPS